MNYSLSVRPGAQRDIGAAVAYYESKRDGLGVEFLRALDAEFESIQSFPSARPKSILNLRVGSTKRFPFYVFYRIEEENISVFAVIHESRQFRRILRNR